MGQNIILNLYKSRVTVFTRNLHGISSFLMKKQYPKLIKNICSAIIADKYLNSSKPSIEHAIKIAIIPKTKPNNKIIHKFGSSMTILYCIIII